MTTTKITTATRLAAEFKGSPRYQAILAVFEAVDVLPDDKPVNDLFAKMYRTMKDLNGIERDRLPDLVRQALKERGRSLRDQ
jgi:hypothetical protein